MIFERLNFWRTWFSTSPSMNGKHLMFSICPGVIFKLHSRSFKSNSLGAFDRHSNDCSFSVFSIVTKLWLVPYLQAGHKKSGRALAYPQARESKPYTHKQETPPAYRREHLSVSLCVLLIWTFRLHRKQLNAFFSICKKHSRFTTVQI